MKNNLDFVIKRRPKSFRRRKDIKVTETTDPKQMLNKYLCQDIRSVTHESFIDQETGDTQIVTRTNIEYQASNRPLDATEVSRLQFLYTTVDGIQPAKVADERLPPCQLEEFSSTPVIILKVHYNLEDYTYAVRAGSFFDAIHMVLDYGSLYCDMQGSVYITSIKTLGCPIYGDQDKEELNAEIRKELTDDEQKVNPNWYSYYKATGTINYYDAEIGKQKTDHATVVVLGNEAHSVENAVLDYLRSRFDEIVDTCDYNLHVDKISPISIDWNVPDSYVQQWYKAKKADQESEQADDSRS